MEHQLSDFSRHSENMRRRGREKHQLGNKFLWKRAELLCTIQCLNLRDKKYDGKGGDTCQVVPGDPCADLWVLFPVLGRLAVWQWLLKPYFPYLSNTKIGQQSYLVSNFSRLSGRSEKINSQSQGLQLSHPAEVAMFLSGCQMHTWLGRPGSSPGRAHWTFHAHLNG